ncbi:hypothetical protein SJ941_14335, partial [Enterococcus faecium]
MTAKTVTIDVEQLEKLLERHSDAIIEYTGELITNSSEILDSDGNPAADFDGDEATNDQSTEDTDELDNMT